MKQGNIKQERKRRKRRRIKLVAALFIVLLLAAAAFVVVKVFTVLNVEVEGNVLYSDDQISTTVLNDEYSWNTLYVYLKYRFLDTETVPFIDTMEISIKDPHTLRIMVYEKGIIGYLFDPSSGKNVYFDKDGFVVELSNNIISDVPQIEGIEVENIVLYEELPIKKDDLRELLTLTQTLKRNNLTPDSIIYGEVHSPVLVYGDVRIFVGDETLLTQKVARIVKIMPTIRSLSGELHLETWTEEATNIVFDKDEETTEDEPDTGGEETETEETESKEGAPEEGQAE